MPNCPKIPVLYTTYILPKLLTTCLINQPDSLTSDLAYTTHTTPI